MTVILGQPLLLVDGIQLIIILTVSLTGADVSS
jgi:hypothetical protein